LLEKPAGKKCKELERWFAGPEGPQALFAGRVLPFDEKAALVWARLMARGTATGRPRSPLDMIVADMAEANDCLVGTDNENDFPRLKIIKPLRAAHSPRQESRQQRSARDAQQFATVCYNI
jgi:predicted nucleic acid-binding protein